MTYLDAASAQPLHPAAREVLLAAYDEGWADPARLYRQGRRARLLLDDARQRVAGVLGARADEVRFAPSGTMAVWLGLTGLLRGRARTGGHAVTGAVEHSSVLKTLGDAATVVPVDRYGRVGAGAFAAALRDDTAVAALQTGNHEVGTLQPVEDVHAACAERGVPLLVDAAQTAGRLPVPPYDVLVASARKWGGPGGVGVLVVRKGARWRDPLPVTAPDDVPAAVAAAVALEAVAGESAALDARLSALVDRVRAEVPRLVGDVEVVGHPVERLPHLVTFSVLYVDGEALVTALDRRGLAVNSGSACTAETLRPSHVLEAMGVLTHGNVRVSLGRETSEADVDGLLAVLPDVVKSLRP